MGALPFLVCGLGSLCCRLPSHENLEQQPGGGSRLHEGGVYGDRHASSKECCQTPPPPCIHAHVHTHTHREKMSRHTHMYTSVHTHRGLSAKGTFKHKINKIDEKAGYSPLLNNSWAGMCVYKAVNKTNSALNSWFLGRYSCLMKDQCLECHQILSFLR